MITDTLGRGETEVRDGGEKQTDWRSGKKVKLVADGRENKDD